MKNIPKNPFLFGIFATKPYKKFAISALIASFIATGLGRYSVVVLRNLTDAITVTDINFSSVWFLALLYIFLYFFVENVIWRASGFIGMRWFTNYAFHAYQSLYEYLTLHSKEYFNSRFAGSLTNKISNAVDGTERMLADMLWNYLPTFVGLFWFVLFVWLDSPLLGFIMIIWSTIFIGVNFWFAKKLKPFSVKDAEASSTLRGRIVDSLSNISLVHEYAYVTGERSYIKKFINKYRVTGLTLWTVSEWILVANGIMLAFFLAMMLGTSIYLFQQQLISVGVIVMVIAILSRLIDQLFFLGQKMKETARQYGQAKEGLEEILKEHTITNVENAQPLTVSKGEITLQSLNFYYEESPVFQNLTLTIPHGQKVGLVGKSGAGKSTFVSLLLRHFEIQQGDIKIDGQSIYQVTLESLRKNIAFVPQDTSLFHRTIKENIAYSSPTATNDEIERAAKQANADEFITKLPQGYETLVGERGVKLSGGQRQRIAIARAFLKNAPIVILDEATSSLDSASEHAIQQSLETLMKGRTVIAIAHRLSTLKEMDRIIVLRDGQIAEDGAPDELLKKPNGIFKTMWEHQVKGFIVDE